MYKLKPEEIQTLRRWSQDARLFDPNLISHRFLLEQAADQLEHQPKEPQWSTDIPTEPGWYWLKGSNGHINHNPVEVVLYDSGSTRIQSGGGFTLKLSPGDKFLKILLPR